MNEEMNELLPQETEVTEDATAPEAVQTVSATEAAAVAECEALIAALAEAKIKLSLLLCGVDKNKLDEAAKLAAAFVAAGLTPEDAAEKAVAEYPHLKLTKRDLPTFATQSGGSGDGFSAIRSIFAKR